MQDYQLIVRTVGPRTIIESGVQNYSEFRDYLQEMYLNQGYRILEANKLSDKPEFGTDVYTLAYHLVKDIEVTPSKAKTDK